jgi:hypothetical protein
MTVDLKILFTYTRIELQVENTVEIQCIIISLVSYSFEPSSPVLYPLQQGG